MSKLPISKLSRLTKLGVGLAKASGELVLDVAKKKANQWAPGNEKIQESLHRLQAAKEIVQTMGELKGGLMKIGQMISLTDDLVLPPEISQLFRVLQKSAPPMEEGMIEKIFEEEFQTSPEKLFYRFEYIPVAAASIGQVHEAWIDARTRVAVKIQYPKIATAIQNDLQHLPKIDRLFSLIYPKKPEIGAILEEVKTSLIDECSYIKESENITLFQDLLKKPFPQIQIPQVFKKFSTDRILTTSFIEGSTFSQSLEWDQSTRDFLGQLLYDHFNFSFFEKGLLHTDPQEGNYFFHPNGFSLIDFGSIKKFSDSFRETYSLFPGAIEFSSPTLFSYACESLGIYQKNAPKEFREKIYQATIDFYGPYLKSGVYAVTEINPFKIFMTLFQNTSHLLDSTQPSPEFVLLDRANLGIFTKLKKWGSRVNWQSGREKYIHPTLSQTLDSLKTNPLYTSECQRLLALIP